MIVYTCPECEEELRMEGLLTYPPKYKTYCPKCGWSHIETETVYKVPYGTVETVSAAKLTTDEGIIALNGGISLIEDSDE